MRNLSRETIPRMQDLRQRDGSDGPCYRVDADTRYELKRAAFLFAIFGVIMPVADLFTARDVWGGVGTGLAFLLASGALSNTLPIGRLESRASRWAFYATAAGVGGALGWGIEAGLQLALQ